MALAKTEVVILNSVTVAAGGSQDSGWVDVDAYEDLSIYVGVLNGATTPTLPAQVQLYTSPTASPTGISIYTMGGPLQADLGNNVQTSWGPIPLPRGTRRFRAVASGNTAQAVTVRVALGTQVK